MTLEKVAADLERAALFDKTFTPKMIGHLRAAAKVARAFPKMLEALGPFAKAAEALDGYRGQQHDRLVHFRVTADHCIAARAALRAAREALGPSTPPQRCADTVTEWTETGERTAPCNHPLPCPLHTPRAAREAVKP